KVCQGSLSKGAPKFQSKGVLSKSAPEFQSQGALEVQSKGAPELQRCTR
ncbi:34537_t:CDS:1, partial [Gigaspora margarita]